MFILYMAEYTNFIRRHLNETLVFISIGILLVLYFVRRRLSPKLPPSPRHIPFIGHALKVLSMTFPSEELKALSDKYGTVMCLKFMNRKVVILSSYDVIYEAFVTQSISTSGRPRVPASGIIMSDGQKWKNTRRFSLSTLREFGYGRDEIQQRILNEVKFLQQRLTTLENNQIDDLRGLLTLTSSNVICALMFGQRLSYDDETFKRLNSAIYNIAKSFNFLDMSVFLDKLQITAAQRKRYADLKADSEYVQSFVRNQIKEHRFKFNENDVRDFIDVYIKTESCAKAEELDGMDIEVAISDLLAAGTETTATTLTWVILYVILLPEVQEKCRAEIYKVAEGGRPITLADKANTPYTCATLLEIQRLSPVGPLAVPHRATDDFILRGYHIPKDTIIFANLYAAHHDSNIFEAPENFRPERFLDAHGNVSNSEFVVPFSLGPRTCLGESLARSELFLFFTNLIQHFTFERVKDSLLNISPQPRMASLRFPQDFAVKVMPC